jgi:C-terminal processing protease CtpA/Prc
MLIIGLSSCEKLVFDDEISNTPESNFNYLWNEINTKYAFLDYKQVNWDSIQGVYQPKIHPDMSNDSLFEVLGGMMNELRDGHVNLMSPFNVSRYDITLLGPQNINTRIIKTHYLKSDYYSTGGFAHNFIREGDVGYIRYPSFSGSSISNYQLDYLYDRYKDCKGIIIDIRQNGGGYVSNVFSLLSLFSDDERHLYDTQIKSGPGADEFTLMESVYANSPRENVFTGKVAVLTDRGSYSASSFFSTCTYAYDDVFLVGDTTGGGLGLPNGGQLPNGWTYRFSITRTIAVNGKNYENGVPPNYTVILSEDADETGIDNVIEFAADKICE